MAGAPPGIGTAPAAGPAWPDPMVDGTVLDGTALDGTVLDGTVLDGTVLDGTAPATGVELAAVAGLAAGA
jgi:hypothetical protein